MVGWLPAAQDRLSAGSPDSRSWGDRAAGLYPGGVEVWFFPAGGSAAGFDILAVDFLHVDTVPLKRLSVLVFIEHGNRRMHLGGVTANPTGEWTVQQARNLAMSLGERFEDIKFLLRDRGPDFTASFDAVFGAAGARILRRPDPSAAPLATAPRRSSTWWRATRTRLPPLWQPRWEGAGRSGSAPAAGTNTPSPPPS